MRRIRYSVAMSLDAYIAGPNGEYDWIAIDPEIDFGEIWSAFDTALLGRHTFLVSGALKDLRTFVFSRTLRQEEYPDVTIVAEKPEEVVASLRSEPGKDIWLFGGGLLFRSLLEARLVDTVEVHVIPILLGEGIPLLPSPAKKVGLRLAGTKVFKTGIVALEYAIEYGPS